MSLASDAVDCRTRVVVASRALSDGYARIEHTAAGRTFRRDAVGALRGIGSGIDPALLGAFLREYDRWLAVSEPFAITEDMARLVAHAAGTVREDPTWTLDLSQFPATAGVLYFATPIFQCAGRPLVAVEWHPLPRDPELAGWYDEAKSMGVMPWGDDYQPGRNTEDVDGDLMAFMSAFWLMCGQFLPALLPVERPARRRSERAGAGDIHAVRVILLRRQRPGGAGAGMSEREYVHRWIVGGHWRNQPYPSRGIIRRIWINPYVKGPDAAPFLDGPTVTVLGR